MARDYPDHGWRTDDFTLIRGDYTATVCRAWCAQDDAAQAWRWSVWHIDRDGGVEDAGIPGHSNRGGLAFAEAIAAAEKFIDERIAEEKLGNVFAFEGAPAPAGECLQ